MNPSRGIRSPKLEKFLQLPVVSDAVGRWVKVSNRGQFDRDRKMADQVLERDGVRIMVDKSLQEPPEPFTEAERALPPESGCPTLLRRPEGQREGV